MIKKIKKYGNTLVIVLTKEDQQIYNLQEGNLIDLSDLVKTQLNKTRRLKNDKATKK